MKIIGAHGYIRGYDKCKFFLYHQYNTDKNYFDVGSSVCFNEFEIYLGIYGLCVRVFNDDVIIGDKVYFKYSDDNIKQACDLIIGANYKPIINLIKAAVPNIEKYFLEQLPTLNCKLYRNALLIESNPADPFQVFLYKNIHILKSTSLFRVKMCGLIIFKLDCTGSKVHMEYFDKNVYCDYYKGPPLFNLLSNDEIINGRDILSTLSAAADKIEACLFPNKIKKIHST